MTQDLREALEQQIAEWRERGQGFENNDEQNKATAVWDCTDELKELLQESENE